MRLLAVIGGELVGADERSDWGVLEALVAANSPESSIEIRVMALVNQPRTGMWSMPLGRAVGARAAQGGGGAASGYDASDGARQRLGRALAHLQGLGLRASGDIEPGDAYRAVRREVARGDYARVLFRVRDRPTE